MLALVAISSGLAVIGAIHAWLNLRLLRDPSTNTHTQESISILVPARNEERRIGKLLTSLTAQLGVDKAEILVLDDQSEDGTADVVRAAAKVDSRIVLLEGHSGPPAGWLGKTWACHRLAKQARGSILIFLDADVVLSPDAISRSVNTLRETSLDLVSPYPKQITGTHLERLVQPLLHWSWITTLPLRIAERSSRPSLTAANGQFLVIDREAYEGSGGFESVKDQVLDDINILRSIKSTGGSGIVIDGTTLAQCRMYQSPSELIDGYAKSLWSAFGGPLGSFFVNALLLFTYVVPFIALFFAQTAIIGLTGVLAGVASRLLVAQRVQGRLLPDCLMHPLSILAFAWINALSWHRHVNGTAQWKGRPV